MRVSRRIISDRDIGESVDSRSIFFLNEGAVFAIGITFLRACCSKRRSHRLNSNSRSDKIGLDISCEPSRISARAFANEDRLSNLAQKSLECVLGE
ncbi:hypothetical protein SNK05_010043 [Fusarium graminearum]